MADYATTWTARLVVTYTYPGGSRQQTWRAPRDYANPALAMTSAARAFYTALAPVLPNQWQALSAVFYPQDEEFSTPVGWGTPIVGTNGVMPLPGPIEYGEAFIQFYGTGPQGSRTSRYIFGSIFRPSVDGYRILAGVNATLDAARNTLINPTGEGGPFWATGSGAIATWKPYVNVKTNDFNVHEQR